MFLFQFYMACVKIYHDNRGIKYNKCVFVNKHDDRESDDKVVYVCDLMQFSTK